EMAREALQHPSLLWGAMRVRWRQDEYLHGAIYQDEADMLDYYCNMETAWRKATNASNWLRISAIPGITNDLDYELQRGVLPGMPSRAMSRLYRSPIETTFVARLAEAQARRGVLVAAIALERYYQKHGSYPDALPDLAPEFVRETPVDFMNGRPLQYRRTGDGHFVLYSVGLVGTNNGGHVAFSTSPVGGGYGRYGGYDPGYDRIDPDGNIVWPPPASQAAAQAQDAEQLDAQAQKEEEQEESAAAAQWDDTARRQLEAAKLLSAPPQKTLDLNWEGVPLSTRLCNTDTAGTNHLTLSQLLTLRQIITGQEPEVVTFKLPIQYDALNQIGRLTLLVDANNGNAEGGGAAQHADLSEASDGDCLLAWNTIYETPGLHALRLDLTVNQMRWPNDSFVGPVLSYTITNLCQFSLASDQYDPAVGAIIHARLQEMNGKYSIDLTTTNGALIKRFAGSTSDGIIQFGWNLIGDDGRRFTNDYFNSLYHITLTDSGRSQTLRGP
ncbi:MAG: hypothetical protein ACREE6_14085, partial [Limisphaerales bacterium]